MRAASGSGSASTVRRWRSSARVRTPAFASSSLARSIRSLVFASTSPNLANSVLTAPSVRHTSLDALLDGERAKAHLQAVEQREEIVGTGEHHAVLALQRVGEARAAPSSRRRGSRRQEQDRRSRSCAAGRRTSSRIVSPARAGNRRAPCARRRRPAGRRAPARPAGAASARAGTCASIGSQHGAPSSPAAGQRIAYSMRRLLPGTGLDVARVLLRRQHLGEQRAELHLAPACRAS